MWGMFLMYLFINKKINCVQKTDDMIFFIRVRIEFFIFQLSYNYKWTRYYYWNQVLCIIFFQVCLDVHKLMDV